MGKKPIQGRKVVKWKDVKVGDTVFIAGNIVDNKPTVVYGPHKVYNVKRKELINVVGRVFKETWHCLYR